MYNDNYYHFNIDRWTKPMTPLDPLVKARLAVKFAEEALARLEVANAARLQYGDDIYPTGTVLHWEKKHSAKGQSYSYAAIKSPVGWSVTGKQTSPVTWSVLVDHLVKDIPVEKLWWAANYTEVAA